MSKLITFSLMASHNKEMKYSLTYDQYFEFRGLIEFGGEKKIGNYRLEVSNGYLTHFKKSSGQPSYTMSLDGVKEVLDEAEDKFLNDSK